MKTYKVLTQDDKWFSGKFDPSKLEAALNAYAAEGWRVVTSATGEVFGVLQRRRVELIIVLEREK